MQYIIRKFDHRATSWKHRKKQLYYSGYVTHGDDANANSAMRRIRLQPRDGSTSYMTTSRHTMRF